MPYANILLPLDGSTDSVFACETATNIVGPQNGQTAHLMHCVEHIPDLIGGKKRSNMHADQQNESSKIFAQAKAILEPKGFTCLTYAREGSPVDEILAVAKETNCDLIIMGTKGHSRLECFLVGEVSSEIIKKAGVPVLLANKANSPA